MKKKKSRVTSIQNLFFIFFLFFMMMQFTACASKQALRNSQRLEIGVAHVNRAHAELGEQEFLAVLATDPSNWAAHYEMGRLESLRGNAMGAMDHFSIVLQKQPYNPSAHANMGWAMIQMHELDEAELHLKNALKLGGEETLANDGLGVVSFHRQQPKESKVFFERALEKDPNDSLAHYYENTFFGSQAAKDPEAVYNDLQQAARFSFKPYNQVIEDTRFQTSKNGKAGSSGRESGGSSGGSGGSGGGGGGGSGGGGGGHH